MDGCLMCHEPFVQGDRGMVIGHVPGDGTAELRWVHIRCLIRDVLGDVAALAYDEGRPVHR